MTQEQHNDIEAQVEKVIESLRPVIREMMTAGFSHDHIFRLLHKMKDYKPPSDIEIAKDCWP